MPENKTQSDDQPEITVPKGHLTLRWESTEGSFGFIVLPIAQAVKTAKRLLRQAEAYSPIEYRSMETLESRVRELERDLSFAETGE